MTATDNFEILTTKIYILTTKICFEKLLRAALQNNFFNFYGKIYKQNDEVAMGSPLGTTRKMHFYVSMNRFGLMIVLMKTCILQKMCW